MASIFGYTGVKEPAYEVAQKAAEYEVRKYGPQLRAVVQMPEDKPGPAFRTLAGYIFGGNTAKGKEGNEKLAMTAPVVMPLRDTAAKKEGEQLAMTAPVSMQGPTMAFVLPADKTSLDQLPTPKDPNVKLIEVPAASYAVIRWSGFLNNNAAKRQEEKLRVAAKRDGLALSSNPGDVQVWGFNPPWTLPMFKRNEVAIPVAK